MCTLTITVLRAIIGAQITGYRIVIVLFDYSFQDKKVVTMPERRRTDPMMTQHIWDAIKFIVHQRTSPNEERVMRHIARTYIRSEQSVLEDLRNAVKDGLVQLKKVASKNGIEQESYRNPVEVIDQDDHDWYCCKCQKAGVVECCQKCHRVFHQECHVPESQELKYCNFCEKINNDVVGDKTDLNHILNFTCGHLKAKLPPEITNRTIVFDNTPVVTPPGGFSGPTWVSEGEDSWRPGILIKHHMDLSIMDRKTKHREYNNLAEFEADAHNIMHNIILYHGGKGSEEYLYRIVLNPNRFAVYIVAPQRLDRFS